jgi:uncharacterized protein YhfF
VRHHERLVRATDELPAGQFGFPGPLRDKLVDAILRGEKTTTSSLVVEYEREGDELPRAGSRSAVVDSLGRRVAVIETTDVRVIRVGEVDLEHARCEGEGFESVAAWRRAHEDFWRSDEFRASIGDAAFAIDDDTLMVAEGFHLLERL